MARPARHKCLSGGRCRKHRAPAGRARRASRDGASSSCSAPQYRAGAPWTPTAFAIWRHLQHLARASRRETRAPDGALRAGRRPVARRLCDRRARSALTPHGQAMPTWAENGNPSTTRAEVSRRPGASAGAHQLASQGRDEGPVWSLVKALPELYECMKSISQGAPRVLLCNSKLVRAADEEYVESTGRCDEAAIDLEKSRRLEQANDWAAMNANALVVYVLAKDGSRTLHPLNKLYWQAVCAIPDVNVHLRLDLVLTEVDLRWVQCAELAKLDQPSVKPHPYEFLSAIMNLTKACLALPPFNIDDLFKKIKQIERVASQTHYMSGLRKLVTEIHDEHSRFGFSELLNFFVDQLFPAAASNPHALTFGNFLTTGFETSSPSNRAEFLDFLTHAAPLRSRNGALTTGKAKEILSRRPSERPPASSAPESHPSQFNQPETARTVEPAVAPRTRVRPAAGAMAETLVRIVTRGAPTVIQEAEFISEYEMPAVRAETGTTAEAHRAQPLGTKETVDALVERARAESLDDKCPICLDVLDGRDIAVLNCPGKPCGKMHVTCAGELLTKSDFCSVCRATVTGFSEVYHRGDRKRPRDECDGGGA